MIPRSSMTIIASGTVSRIDCRWASRPSASRALVVRPPAVALQQLPAPGDADANDSERRGIDDLGHAERERLRKKKAEQRAERGRQQSRSQPAEGRSNQDRRHEQQIGRVVRQQRLQRQPGSKGERHGKRCDAVAKRLLAEEKASARRAWRPPSSRFTVQAATDRLDREAFMASWSALRETP